MGGVGGGGECHPPQQYKAFEIKVIIKFETSIPQYVT